MPKRVVNLACWKGRSTIGMDAFGMQSLWKVRNFRTFQGTERPMMVMKLVFLHTLYEWMATLSGHSFPSLLDLMDFYTFCNLVILRVLFVVSFRFLINKFSL